MAFIDPYAHLRPTEQEVPPGMAVIRVDGQLHAVAPLERRFLAVMLDLVLFRVALVPVAVMGGFLGALEVARGTPTATPILAVAAYVALVLWWWGPLTFRGHGQSPGKRLLGLRVVTNDGGPPSLGRLVLRELPWRAPPFFLLPISPLPAPLDLLAVALGGLALLSATDDPRRRTLYDRMAGTAVVLHDPLPMAAPPEPAFVRGAAHVPRGLELATAEQGATEGDLVGVFEVGADGEARGESGDADVGGDGAQFAGEVECCRLAGGGRVGRHDQLAYVGAAQAPVELGQVEVVGVDAVERRECAAEDVVAPVELVGALE